MESAEQKEERNDPRLARVDLVFEIKVRENKIDWNRRNLGCFVERRARYTSGWNFFIETLHPLLGGAVPSSKHFGQPKETHLPADKHGESPWRRRSRTVLALPRGEVERGMCLGLFALQDNIPSLLKDESRERSRYFISPLRPSSPFLLSVSSAFYLTLVLAQHPRFFSSSPTIFRAVQNLPLHLPQKF